MYRQEMGVRLRLCLAVGSGQSCSVTWPSLDPVLVVGLGVWTHPQPGGAKLLSHLTPTNQN